MKRRGFFGLIAALPFAGKLKPIEQIPVPVCKLCSKPGHKMQFGLVREKVMVALNGAPKGGSVWVRLFSDEPKDTVWCENRPVDWRTMEVVGKVWES